MMLTATPTAPIDRNAPKRIALLVSRVIQQSDDLVIVFEYMGKNGAISKRVVSPIRFVGTDRFLALCLTKEEPRQFFVANCRNVRVDLAANYTMPVEL